MLNEYIKVNMNSTGKRRRQAADFPGANTILKQLKEKPKRKRVGFLSTGPPARGIQFIQNIFSKNEYF